jgi:hypothetical protein
MGRRSDYGSKSEDLPIIIYVNSFRGMKLENDAQTFFTVSRASFSCLHRNKFGLDEVF